MSLKKNIATPSMTQEIIEKYDLKAKKSLGQNFIIDTNILKNMIAAAGITEESQVIEVGPGIGALTEQLAMASKQVVAFEIDQRFMAVLEDTLSDYDNIEVINQDILEVELDKALADFFDLAKPIHLVANLPYYITTPILMHFLESTVPIETMTVMIQKEVADRISAEPGTKAYGSLSIAIQYYMDTEIASIVPATVFNPAPNVDSAILHLERKSEKPAEVQDETFFFKMVRAAFAQRRKTIRNNMVAAFGKDTAVKEAIDRAFVEADIDSKRRGETLTIEEFARVSNALQDEGLRFE